MKHNHKKNSVLNHVLTLLDKGYRYDRRQPTEMRPITVETGVVANAEGSAKVTIGDTEVIAGVKLSIEKPYPDTPKNGNMGVNVELLAMSSKDFEPGPPTPQAIEIARVVDRGIRESGALDTSAMCIEEGEKVWTAMIDVCTINAAGNLQDAASLAAMAALKNTRLPEVVDGVINYKSKTDAGLPMNDEPIEVTVSRIGTHLIVDPIVEEEAAIEAWLTVAVAKDGRICALQKGGNGSVTPEDVDKMVDIAFETANKLREYI